MSFHIDETRLAARAAGRKAGKEAVALLQEVAPGALLGDGETLLAFWDEISTFVNAQLPPVTWKTPEILASEKKLTPLSAREAVAFVQETVPYGEFRHQVSGNVPPDRLDWYVRMHEDNSGWIERAARYLLRLSELGQL